MRVCALFPFMLVVGSDDPKKNTAVLASKRGDMRLHKSIKTLPKRASFSNCSVARFSARRSCATQRTNGALVGLDCSWAHIEASVESVMKRTRHKLACSTLFAANPVNLWQTRHADNRWAMAAVHLLAAENNQNRFLVPSVSTFL